MSGISVFRIRNPRALECMGSGDEVECLGEKLFAGEDPGGEAVGGV